MRHLLLVATICGVASCASGPGPQRHAEIAEQIARAKAGGLAAAHPRRIELERAFERSRSSGRATENSAELERRIGSLQAERAALLAQGLGRKHPQVRNLDLVLVYMRELESR